MKLRFPHRTTPGEARGRIESLLDRLETRHAKQILVTDRTWAGNTLHFAFKARGLPAKGTVTIGEEDVVINGDVPLVARPFEGKITRAIEKEAAELFSRKA